ncbi:MAG: hypothetical protein ACI30N_08140 [Muribaculaceae bacterium]
MTGKHKSVTVHNLYACGYSGLAYPHSADARAGKTALAGAAYKEHPATVRHTCSSTSEALRRVTRWLLSPSWLPVRNGTYGAGELDCDVTTDGDGRQTLLFTDAAGRTVLQRSVADGGAYADTYYITDSWGNPLMVIPPEATKAFAVAGSAAQDADIVDNYCYIYRYDSHLRVTSKKLPGAGEHVFAYDSEGRQAFSRDGNRYGRDRRAFALYDALGRVAVTGTCQDAADEAWWSQPSSSRPAITARRSGSVYGVRLAAEAFFAQAGAGLGYSGVYSGVDGGTQCILVAVKEAGVRVF